jgi:hypothetical protein
MRHPRRIVAYCSPDSSSSHLDSLRPSPLIAEGWPDFERHAARADVLVVVVESLPSWPHFREARRLRLRLPHLPTILVTRLDDAAVRFIAKIEVAGVVPNGDADALSKAVQEARAGAMRLRVARAAIELENLDRHERRMVHALYSADPPPASNREWARASMDSLRTLERHVGRRLRPSGLPARVLIGAGLYLAAASRVRRPGSFDDLAVEVGELRCRLDLGMQGADIGAGRLQRAVGSLIPVRNGARPPPPEELARTLLERLRQVGTVRTLAVGSGGAELPGQPPRVG